MTRNELEVFAASELEERLDNVSDAFFKQMCDKIVALDKEPWWNEECVNDGYMSFIVCKCYASDLAGKAKLQLPRGFRNNNPGNIRLTKSKWVGLCKEQKDGAFCQFTDLKYGFRAMLKLLDNYYYLNHCWSVRDIIARWAPPSDGNNTEAYIRFVANNSFVTPARKLSQPLTDKSFWVSLVVSMSLVENGKYDNGYKESYLQRKAGEAWELLYKNPI